MAAKNAKGDEVEEGYARLYLSANFLHDCLAGFWSIDHCLPFEGLAVMYLAVGLLVMFTVLIGAYVVIVSH